MAQIDSDPDLLNQRNLRVLRSYAERQIAAAAIQDHDGWLDRMEPSGDLDADQLTRVHGQLIALGLLKFELSCRKTGLRYQVSDLGRGTLSRHAAAEAVEIHDAPVSTSANWVASAGGSVAGLSDRSAVVI